MVTVLRFGGFSVRIYKGDHPPAHVHVVTGTRRKGGEAKIHLGGEDGPELIWAKRMTRAEIRDAFALVVERRDALFEKWRSIHGV